MSISIEKNEQSEMTMNLIKALDKVKTSKTTNEFTNGLTSQQFNLLEKIFLGDHKTYKYILLAALTAKYTVPKVNILSLQAKANVPGAYDNRSLLKNIIVPFERKYLNNQLGGSNEPGANKPARYEMLDKSNAVRRGSDQDKLNTLVDVLPTFDDKNLFNAICYSLYLVINDYFSINVNNMKLSNSTQIELYNRLILLNSKPIEGQTLPLVIAYLFSEYVNSFIPNGKILIHPVNEAGTSSLEVGDIDVVNNLNNKLIYTIEAKDKKFNLDDIEHAAQKAGNAGLRNLFFIYGESVVDYATKQALSKWQRIIYQRHNVFVAIQSIYEITKTFIALCDLNDSSKAVKLIADLAKNARMNDKAKEQVSKSFI